MGQDLIWPITSWHTYPNGKWRRMGAAMEIYSVTTKPFVPKGYKPDFSIAPTIEELPEANWPYVTYAEVFIKGWETITIVSKDSNNE